MTMTDTTDYFPLNTDHTQITIMTTSHTHYIQSDLMIDLMKHEESLGDRLYSWH